MYTKPRKAPPSLLSFLEPFDNDVWITSLASIVLVSLLTFLIGKLYIVLPDKILTPLQADSIRTSGSIPTSV